jgi:cytochrome P450
MVGEVRASRRALRDDFESVLDGLYGSGDLVWVDVGKQRFLLVNDPEAVREVLVERSAELVKPRLQAIDTGPPRPERVDETVPVAVFRRAVTAGLAGRDGEAASAAVAAAEAETAEWRDGARIELMPMLRRIAIRTASRGAFASRLDDEDVARLDAVLRWFADAPRVLPASRFSRHSLRRVEMRQLLTEVAASLCTHADLSTPSELSVVLHALPELDRRARSVLVGELLLGAVGPLAQTASWLLLRFTTAPEEAARLRAEWPGLQRTAAFVREVTRLHPTNPRITRAALVDTVVGGEPVPAHTRVVLNVNGLNRDARLYAEPDRLLPERWLGDRPQKLAYLSFGLGERRCLGETLALSALAALLPALLADWELELSDRRVTSAGRRQLAEGTVATVRPAPAG